MQSGQRTRRNVTNRVVAGFAGCQPDVSKPVQNVRNVSQRDKMELHVLPSGQVTFTTRIIVSDDGQLPHLFRREQSARHFSPDHVHTGLALAVNPAPQAMRPELIVIDRARGVGLSLRSKQLDVLPNGPVVFFGNGLQVRKGVGDEHSLIPYRDYHIPQGVRSMAIMIVRLGSPRTPHEGLRIGTVRRPPRGVPKAEFSRRDYYDVWLPNLSPSQELVKEALSASTERAWSGFVRKFRAEMNRPEAARPLDVLAALSHSADFS